MKRLRKSTSEPQRFVAGFVLAGSLAMLAAQRLRRPDFAGKSVVITGGSRGLGFLLAREFASRGANLTLLARDAADLASAEEELRSAGVRLLSIACDVRDRPAVQDAIERVVEHYGSVDVLINNAGIIQVGPLEHMRVEDFAESLATHMWGTLYASLAVLPHMRRQGGGRIANITSIGGVLSVPHLLPYNTSKAAQIGLSDSLRAELAQYGIRVTTVIPGLMRTGSHFNALFKGRHRREFAWFAISDALPVTSINARRAARQIVDAVGRGAPRLIVTPQARLAVLADTLFPGIVARGMALANRLLPEPAPDRSSELYTGWQSQSRWAPSVLTRLADKAIPETNSLRGHEPVV
jgi:NAD(P)-dependent dehydrogenase (short-subunit alcohol dehydrogenase family)